MKKKNNPPLLGKILKKVAPLIGAKVVVEPVWNIVGQITFKNGRRTYFRYTSLDLNHLGASETSKDKDYANFFLKRMGYPIIPGSKTFFSNEWSKAIGMPNRNMDEGYHYAQRLGFPVIVKPNSKSQGIGVALVHNRSEFYRAIRNAFKNDRVVLVQKPVRGKDYRLVILDNEIISAYERTPLNVIGDGKSTILRLLKKKQLRFNKIGRHTQIKLNDPRITEKLKRQKINFQFVLRRGEKIFLLDNANLSTGGDSIDVTDKIHPLFKKIVIKLTKDMGLRLCGVDIMVNGDISDKPKIWWILETNSAPGLDHYAQHGKKQKKIVENLYLKILKKMENDNFH